MRIAPAVAVAALLVAAFASYLVYVDWTAPDTVTRTTPLISLTQHGNFTYEAALDPNPLYDGTVLHPGEGTLFTTFTRWINVMFTYTLTSDRAADLTVAEQAEVGLSGSVWYRAVAWDANTTAASGVRGQSLVRTFALDVPALLATMRDIDNATKASALPHAIEVRTSISAAARVAGRSVPVSMNPVLYLNITGTRIVPGAMDFLAAQDAVTSSLVPAPPPDVDMNVALAILAASLVTFAAAGAATRRRPDVAEELDRMMRPYLEAIAETTAPAKAATTVEMVSWADLVKVADTLGKPVLRARVGNPDPDDVVFFVLDGDTCYRYGYEPREGAGPAADGIDPLAQLRQAQLIVARLRLLAREGEDVRPYCRRMRRGLHLMSRGRWKRSRSVLAQVEARLDDGGLDVA